MLRKGEGFGAGASGKGGLEVFLGGAQVRSARAKPALLAVIHASNVGHRRLHWVVGQM